MSPKKSSKKTHTSNQNGTELTGSSNGTGTIELDIAANHNAKDEGSSMEQGYRQQTDSAYDNMDIFAKTIINIRSALRNALVPYTSLIGDLIIGALFVTYWIYFAFAVKLTWTKSENYCDGVRLLFIITVLSTAAVIYNKVIKRVFGNKLNRSCIQPLSKAFDAVWRKTAFRWAFIVCCLAGIIAFLVLDSKNNRKRLISIGGILIIVTCGFIFSKHPGHVMWRKTLWGLGLQYFFALIILRWDVGRDVFQCLANKVTVFLAFTDAGSSFIYGYLVTGQLKGWDNSTGNSTLPEELPAQAPLFAFKVLPVVYFFSFCISILYFYGIMQWIVRNLGWLLQITIGTTAGESINSAAAIFVGMSEAPLVIKPYLSLMTMSELHAVMAGGIDLFHGIINDKPSE